MILFNAVYISFHKFFNKYMKSVLPVMKNTVRQRRYFMKYCSVWEKKADGAAPSAAFCFIGNKHIISEPLMKLNCRLYCDILKIQISKRFQKQFRFKTRTGNPEWKWAQSHKFAFCRNGCFSFSWQRVALIGQSRRCDVVMLRSLAGHWLDRWPNKTLQ